MCSVSKQKLCIPPIAHTHVMLLPAEHVKIFILTHDKPVNKKQEKSFDRISKTTQSRCTHAWGRSKIHAPKICEFGSSWVTRWFLAMTVASSHAQAVHRFDDIYYSEWIRNANSGFSYSFLGSHTSGFYGANKFCSVFFDAFKRCIHPRTTHPYECVIMKIHPKRARHNTLSINMWHLHRQQKNA